MADTDNGVVDGETCLYFEGLYFEAFINSFLASKYFVIHFVLMHVKVSNIRNKIPNIRPKIIVINKNISDTGYPKKNTAVACSYSRATAVFLLGHFIVQCHPLIY